MILLSFRNRGNLILIVVPTNILRLAMDLINVQVQPLPESRFILRLKRFYLFPGSICILKCIPSGILILILVASQQILWYLRLLFDVSACKRLRMSVSAYLFESLLSIWSCPIYVWVRDDEARNKHEILSVRE